MSRTAELRPSQAIEGGANADRQRLLHGLALRERRTGINGVETSLLECGDGPPLVLLHGGIECGGVVWAPVIAQLSESHHVVIPDVPGLGESRPVARLDGVAFDEWFGALLRATGAARPALIAHSLMGTMALRFAAQHPDALSRLVVYGAPGVGPYRIPFALRVAAILFSLRPSERNAERFDRLAFADFDRFRREEPGWMAAFSGYTRSRARVKHVKRTMRQLIGSCTRQVPDAELRRIAVPTTLLWGRYDRFVPLTVAQEAGARFGWPVAVIEEAGHVPHIERSQAFLDVVDAILSGEPLAGDRSCGAEELTRWTGLLALEFVQTPDASVSDV